jgi:hypothetical protein
MHYRPVLSLNYMPLLFLSSPGADRVHLFSSRFRVGKSRYFDVFFLLLSLGYPSIHHVIFLSAFLSFNCLSPGLVTDLLSDLPSVPGRRASTAEVSPSLPTVDHIEEERTHTCSYVLIDNDMIPTSLRSATVYKWCIEAGRGTFLSICIQFPLRCFSSPRTY